MAHEVLRGTITALVVSRPAAMAAQEDAYRSCSEEVACYTASGCRQGSAGGLQLAMFDDGCRAVVEGPGDATTLEATHRNAYQVPTGDGILMIVPSNDWSPYHMTQVSPDMNDAATVVTGRREGRNH
jgi:hypothetical protein